jgi:c(7)-type cytochrome triheme protein
MSRYGSAALALVGGLVLAWSLVLLAEAQVKIPPDFTFEQGKESPGTVTFSHAKHRESGVDKCQACHTKIFKMKKGQSGPFAMEKMKAGEQCGSCHNTKTKVADKVVFGVEDKANCEKCHRKS